MKVHTIDLLFMGREEAIAAFLLECPEGWILVETGPESTRERLCREIAAFGVDPLDLDAVFVTHVHLDHAGAAGWFAKKGVPVLVHPKGARHIVDPSRLIESAREVYGSQFDSLWGNSFPGREGHVHPIEGGTAVEVAGIEVEAIETPGHAFHHHAFRVGNVCFTGDAAGASLDRSGFISVTSAPPQFHLEQTISSIDKLRERGFEEIYLTHYGKVDDPTTHFENYRDAVEVSALFVKQRLDEGMDEESLRIAYEALQFEQAFRYSLPREVWDTFQLVNGTGMCADGLRLFWEKQREEET